MKMRIVTALAVCLALSPSLAVDRAQALPTAPAAAAVPQAIFANQAVTGGGTGILSDFPAPAIQHDGNYTSTGQLGAGHFSFEAPVTHGPARFTRSDGMQLTGVAESTQNCGQAIPSNAYCVAIDLDGTADIAHAHLIAVVEDEVRDQDTRETTAFLMRGTLTLNSRVGYAMVASNGTTYGFGGVAALSVGGSPDATDIELTPSGGGYWVVNAVGNVRAFGDAGNFSTDTLPSLAAGERITSMSSTPSGNGLWLFTSRGRVLPYGRAGFYGDLNGEPIQGHIVGSIATPTGKGYYMVATDGGVFAFGDAKFHGSTGNMQLNKPVVGLVPTADNTGYWLVASDGGVFSFNAPFKGSMGATHLNQPITSMVGYAGSYMMIATDGGIFNFSKGPFFGSLGGVPVPNPIVGGASIS